MWNSVGIAESIEKFVQSSNLYNLNKEHVEIFAGCMVQPLNPEDRDIWFRIYENLKSYVFIGLCDTELCTLCGEILKKFITFEALTDDVLAVKFPSLCPLVNVLFPNIVISSHLLQDSDSPLSP